MNLLNPVGRMIPLYKPYMPLELPELDEILHSGALSYGRWGKKFEKLLAGYVGNQNIITTNTYPSAIQIALTALGLKSGDEVIASPMSCMASNMPLVTFGLRVKWCDVDPDTGTLSPDALKHAIGTETKLIFHNHYCGYVGYVDEVNQIAHEHGIPVIDDCVEAFGSEYKGAKTGNLGTDVSIFSFQTVRLPNTIDGGAIAFRDAAILERAKIARDLGINRANFRDSRNEISPLCDISTLGYAGTMSDVNSYIGSLQVKELPYLLEKQRGNAAKWNEWFKVNLPLAHTLNDRKEVLPNYWVYGFLTDDKQDVLDNLRAKGFYASGVHLNNNCYSVFGKKCYLPGVTDFYNKFLAVPCGWWTEI